ncbi:unnamed protein product [Callosobruchus maculatus]|uniref:Uncharacterized protein n=1 Tax=Callosobruchus maculatus TaxID=64391 RepID=A0A653DWL1_CALMS|nr:unnamed protein product [Callosobruchus maculatus]
MSNRSKKILAAALNMNCSEGDQAIEEALSHSIIFSNEVSIVQNLTDNGSLNGICAAEPPPPVTLSYLKNVSILELQHNVNSASLPIHEDDSTVLIVPEKDNLSEDELFYADVPCSSASANDFTVSSGNLQTSYELLEQEINAVTEEDAEAVPNLEGITNDGAEKENEHNENEYESNQNVVVNEGENSNDEQGIQRKRKRKRKPEKNEWTRERTKCSRMYGKNYLGYTRNKSGQVLQNKERQSRHLGPSCSSKKCINIKTDYAILLLKKSA